MHLFFHSFYYYIRYLSHYVKNGKTKIFKFLMRCITKLAFCRKKFSLCETEGDLIEKHAVREAKKDGKNLL